MLLCGELPFPLRVSVYGAFHKNATNPAFLKHHDADRDPFIRGIAVGH